MPSKITKGQQGKSFATEPYCPLLKIVDLQGKYTLSRQFKQYAKFKQKPLNKEALLNDHVHYRCFSTKRCKLASFLTPPLGGQQCYQSQPYSHIHCELSPSYSSYVNHALDHKHIRFWQSDHSTCQLCNIQDESTFTLILHHLLPRELLQPHRNALLAIPESRDLLTAFMDTKANTVTICGSCHAAINAIQMAMRNNGYWGETLTRFLNIAQEKHLGLWTREDTHLALGKGIIFKKPSNAQRNYPFAEDKVGEFGIPETLCKYLKGTQEGAT